MDNEESFQFVTPNHYSRVNFANNHLSRGQVQRLREKLRDMNGRQFPALLVANKCDIGSARKISIDEGKQLSKLWGIPYLEVSAKRHTADVISSSLINIKHF